jgi:hypothetical protein
MWEKEKEAYRNGKRIQVRNIAPCRPGDWLDCEGPSWLPRDLGIEYRIHPKDAKPDKWLVRYAGDLSMLQSPHGMRLSTEHAEKIDALKVAEAYAKANLGTTFYVCKVVSATCAKVGPPVVCTEVY